jgi:hypothetical protein
MRTAISTLELREPRSVTDALKMLRDDGPLVPLAGATDLYVALNFGTLPGTRFLDLWRLGALRKIEKRGDLLHYEAALDEEAFVAFASRRVVEGILALGPQAVAASFVVQFLVPKAFVWHLGPAGLRIRHPLRPISVPWSAVHLARVVTSAGEPART